MSDGVPLSARAVARSFRDGDRTVHALAGIDVDAVASTWTLVTGPSGAGKTTLLAVLGGLLPPDAGRVTWQGEDLYSLPDGRRAACRARIGLAFQEPRYLRGLDLQDNVGYPLVLRGAPRRERRRAAAEWLERLGLGARMGLSPERLSGGERRRMGLARALVAEPAVVLADEPTSGLDDAGAAALVAVLDDARARGAALVAATHHVGRFPAGARRITLSPA